MKLLIKKRPFEWNASYKIQDENNRDVYQISGSYDEKKHIHSINLYNINGVKLGHIDKKEGKFNSSVKIICSDELFGTLEKERHFSVCRYALHVSDWEVFGLPLSWDYDIREKGSIIIHAGSEGTKYENSDYYVLDVYYANNEITGLLVALALEAAASLIPPRKA
jgi:uncharacterized protein YxjI